MLYTLLKCTSFLLLVMSHVLSYANKPRYSTLEVSFDGECFEELSRLVPYERNRRLGASYKRSKPRAYIRHYRSVKYWEKASFDGESTDSKELYWDALIYGFEKFKRYRLKSLLKHTTKKDIDGRIMYAPSKKK